MDTSSNLESIATTTTIDTSTVATSATITTTAVTTTAATPSKIPNTSVCEPIAQISKSSTQQTLSAIQSGLCGISDISIVSNRPTAVPAGMQHDERLIASTTSGTCAEGPCSVSSAPSVSSSPNLSPLCKIFGRNANGTMIATSRPGNDAEAQLYRVLQRASLLSYYDTLLEMGGDDVQQLYEAGEEEFLEIMALVGMASKPLHVRRLQKALHEWANNPSVFQFSSLAAHTPSLCETPKKTSHIANIHVEPSPTIRSYTRYPSLNPTTSTLSTFSPLALFNPSAGQISGASVSTASQQTTNFIPDICIPMTTPTIKTTQTTTATASGTAVSLSTIQVVPTSIPVQPLEISTKHHQLQVSHQVTSSSPQLPPVLTDSQILRIKQGAEQLANQLPKREPRAHPSSKKRTGRVLEQVIAMSENDPRRLDEIRKYSAIYGRFDCKRRPEKPLTLHELCVNEAAAQLCCLVPALLTRRDELFPLARQIVKNVGFGHSAIIARYFSVETQEQLRSGTEEIDPRSPTLAVESLNTQTSSRSSTDANASKRKRSPSLCSLTTPELSRDSGEDTHYNFFALYQKFAKQSYEIDFSEASESHLPWNDGYFHRISICGGVKMKSKVIIKGSLKSKIIPSFPISVVWMKQWITTT